MLVLSRHRNEAIYLTLPRNPEELMALAGSRITVVLVENRGGKIRLGFAAPKSVDIRRKELVDADPQFKA